MLVCFEESLAVVFTDQDMSSVDQKIITDIADLMNSLNVNVDDSGNLRDIFEKLHLVITGAKAEQVLEAVNESALECLITAVGSVSSADKDTLLICDDILNYVLRSIPVNVLFARFTPQFIIGLNSKSTIVKKRFLTTMRRALENNGSALNDMLASGSPILISACRCLAESDADVASEAQRFLVLVAKQSQGLQVLFKQNELVLMALREMLLLNEIIRFRVHGLISEWSQISLPLLEECRNAGFVAKLLEELSVDDILVKMNALEILTTMSIGSPHCLNFFYESGILNRLYELFQLAQSSPDATFLFPAVMKFFGHIARLHPEHCNQQFPAFLQAVFHMILNYRLFEVGQRLLAFDTLALYASTYGGKAVLAKYDNEMNMCMKAFGQCIREGPMEMRSRHLQALNDVIRLEPDKLNDQSLLSLTEKWFDGLKAGINTTRDPFVFLFDVLKQPINDVRPSLCNIFRSLLVQPWAQDRVLKLAGFIEYVTSPLDCREAYNNVFRHEIAGLLLKSSSCPSKLDDSSRTKLQAFYDQGPFYKGVSEVKVGMESA